MKNPVIYLAIILIFAANMVGQEQKRRTLALDSGTRIDGQLQGSVDVKKSRVGDQVVLKTTKDVKQDGRTVVPKGSKLLGRVTEVTQKSKQNGGSRLGMIFDRLEGKNLSAPISASIISITNAAAGAGLSSDMASADVFGSSSSSTQTTTSSGGGLLGGATSTAGSVLGATTQSVGGVTNAVGNTVANTAGTLGNTVSGIQISGSTNTSAQSGSTLSARDKNIRLEKGTTIGLQVNNSARVN